MFRAQFTELAMLVGCDTLGLLVKFIKFGMVHTLGLRFVWSGLLGCVHLFILYVAFGRSHFVCQGCLLG